MDDSEKRLLASMEAGNAAIRAELGEVFELEEEPDGADEEPLPAFTITMPFIHGW